MPYTQEQENYFKLITLIYCYGANVNRELLHRFLHSTNTTLEQFINDHQHEIYHFFCNAKCCQCKKKATSKPKVINHHQMLSIFENSHTDRLDNHQNQRTEQLCCLKANKSVELKDLDFTLIRFFLVQFCYKVFWDCHLKNENKSFSAFLVENVHKVYHLSVDKICCCMCNVDRDIPDRCIHQKQFEIICKQGSLPCPHPFCSCQYIIQSDLTLSSLIEQDTDLTTKLTKHFCSCLKFLENIYENRNKIAHHPNCCINNDTFWEIWNETKPNILEVAKALDKENQYKADLQELIDGPSNKLVFLTVVLNLLKTSEHVTVNTLQKIEGKADSIEDKIGAVYSLVEDIKIAKFNNMNSSDCSGLSIVNSLRDIAIALCKEKSSEGNADNFQKKEVSFELKIQVNPASIQTAQGSEDDNSDLDTPEDSFTCGRCQENFNKLKQFCKHKETCDTKRVKPGKQILEISGKFIISEASERLEKNAAKMFQDNPDQFDTNEIDVRYVERGCLIVWTESSQYDLENEDQLKKDCIQFTKNMFEKCSLDSTESTNIKVNVKFSKTFQDSSETKDDQSDYLHCGSCRQEFSTINSFISHKKECIRNRKISKQKQEDILKLPQISEESPETISRTKSNSTNQFISSQLPQMSEESPETISRTKSNSTNQFISSQAFYRDLGGMQQSSIVFAESTKTSSLTGLTKEEFNFAKTGMIVLNIFGDVLFDLLKQDQPNLRPRWDCDITYLYSEHRKLNKHIPSNRWGGQWQNIQSTDIAIGDDIERIRLTRNELLQSRIFKLDEIRFNGLCTIIADLLKRFDHHNKPARLYTDHFYEIISKTIHDEEGKSVMHQLKNEIKSEMAFEVEIEHKVKVEPQ